MAIIPTSGKPLTFKQVSNLTAKDEKAILNFLQGAVRAYCKSSKNGWFGLRDLMGGQNNDWGGTPMQILFDRHKTSGASETEAKRKAGMEGGHLLKRMLHEDSSRTYRYSRAFRHAVYQLVP